MVIAKGRKCLEIWGFMVAPPVQEGEKHRNARTTCRSEQKDSTICFAGCNSA